MASSETLIQSLRKLLELDPEDVNTRLTLNPLLKEGEHEPLFQSAKNYARFSNQAGEYDDLLHYLGEARMKR